MGIFKRVRSVPINKLPSVLLGVFITVILVIALIITANKMMEYVHIKQENTLLQTKYDNKIKEIDELKYYINSEINDEYKEKMARLLGYCYPEEIIYYIE